MAQEFSEEPELEHNPHLEELVDLLQDRFIDAAQAERHRMQRNLESGRADEDPELERSVSRHLSTPRPYRQPGGAFIKPDDPTESGHHYYSILLKEPERLPRHVHLVAPRRIEVSDQPGALGEAQYASDLRIRVYMPVGLLKPSEEPPAIPSVEQITNTNLFILQFIHNNGTEAFYQVSHEGIWPLPDLKAESRDQLADSIGSALEATPSDDQHASLDPIDAEFAELLADLHRADDTEDLLDLSDGSEIDEDRLAHEFTGLIEPMSAAAFE